MERLAEILKEIHEIQDQGQSPREANLRKEYHEVLRRNKVPYRDAYVMTRKLARTDSEFYEVMGRVRETVLSYGG